MRSASSKNARLLAIDLDGTLLDAAGDADERDVAAIAGLLGVGVPVTILTGRLYSGTRHVAERLGLRGPVGCVDGSQVVSAETHTTIMHHGIAGRGAVVLRESMERAGSATFLFAGDAIVHDEMGDPYLGYVGSWSQAIERTSRVVAHPFWERDDGITAIVSVGSVSQISGAAEEIQDRIPEIAEVAVFPVRRVRNMWGMVVRAKGGTKGTALRWMADHYGVSIEETVCIGDWLNDVSMLEIAGRAYAMGQAPEEVKSVATHVLEETGETGGGIARAIEESFGRTD